MDSLDDMLEKIQVSDDWEAASVAGNTSFPKGWFGVSDEDEGYIAYFAHETDALAFRLFLINARLNNVVSRYTRQVAADG